MKITLSDCADVIGILGAVVSVMTFVKLYNVTKSIKESAIKKEHIKTLEKFKSSLEGEISIMDSKAKEIQLICESLSNLYPIFSREKDSLKGIIKVKDFNKEKTNVIHFLKEFLICTTSSKKTGLNE